MPKKGLVVEGGGIRGAHTCGALMTMAARGVTAFDVVCATSAGACSAVFLVSGQHDKLGVIWKNYLHDGRFIKIPRLLSGGSAMDLDYLIDEVFTHREPLDLDAVRRSPIHFLMTTTDCETGQPHYFDNSHLELLRCLKASAAMPLAYRPEIRIDGRRYLDGGITESIPIQKAIDEGCDDIVVLLTREAGYRKEGDWLVPKLFQRKYPRLAEALRQRHHHYNHTLERIERGDYPAKLTVIQPQGPTPVSRLTTDREKIFQAIAQGKRDAVRVFDAANGAG